MNSLETKLSGISGSEKAVIFSKSKVKRKRQSLTSLLCLSCFQFLVITHFSLPGLLLDLHWQADPSFGFFLWLVGSMAAQLSQRLKFTWYWLLTWPSAHSFHSTPHLESLTGPCQKPKGSQCYSQWTSHLEMGLSHGVPVISNHHLCLQILLNFLCMLSKSQNP